METNNKQTKPTGIPKNRTLLFGGIAIVVVAVIVTGVYLALNSGGGNTNPSAGGNSGISGASSLQFSVTTTTSSGNNAGTFTYTYFAKNIGTSNLMMRIEYAASNLNYVYIVNGVEKKAWVGTNNVWTDLSGSFDGQLSTWNGAFKGYTDFLVNYVGGSSYTYTSSNGDSIKYTNIIVNPSLADSLFAHT